MDEDWQFEELHHEGYIDIFRITGFEQHRVQLELGMMAHNLLVEEYPLATRDLKQIDKNHWLLDTQVCDYVGIGRFVMGLSGDIKILTPEFEAYMAGCAEEINQRYNHAK